jgi:hypothetical protein
VPEVGVTVVATHFHTVFIRSIIQCLGIYRFLKARPTCGGIELMARLKQLDAAAYTGV